MSVWFVHIIQDKYISSQDNNLKVGMVEGICYLEAALHEKLQVSLFVTTIYVLSCYKSAQRQSRLTTHTTSFTA